MVWGNHGDDVTATVTIKDNANETLGTVVVDRYTNTVTVTKHDPRTDETSSARFTYSDNKIHKKGKLDAEAAGPDEYNSFTNDPTQVVTLRPFDTSAGGPPVSVQIAHNLGSTKDFTPAGGLGVLIGMDAPYDPANPDHDQDMLVVTGGRVGNDPAVDPKQMTADFYGDAQSIGESARSVSPMPRDDTTLGKLGRFFGHLF